MESQVPETQAMESQVPETQAMESQVPETQQPIDAAPAMTGGEDNNVTANEQQEKKEESQVGETQVGETHANEQEEQQKEQKKGDAQEPQGEAAKGEDAEKQEEQEGAQESQADESQVPETMAMDTEPVPQQENTATATAAPEAAGQAGDEEKAGDQGTAAEHPREAQQATDTTQPTESHVSKTQSADAQEQRHGEKEQHQQEGAMPEEGDNETQAETAVSAPESAATVEADESQGNGAQEARTQQQQQQQQQQPEEEEEEEEEKGEPSNKQGGSAEGAMDEMPEASQAEAGMQEETSDVLNAIFGDSDDEEDEESGTFEGFDMPPAPPAPPSPPPKRKAAGKQRKPQGGKRKAKQQDEQGDTQDNERPSTSLPDPFARKKPKRRKNTGIDTNVDDKAVAMLAEMDKAAEADSKAMAQGRPAFGKLSLLPKVVTAISKPQLQPFLMDNGLCDRLVLWLQPYENSTLPNVNIRSKLLRVIESMPLSADDSPHLRSSKLDVTCAVLRRHPQESKENKRRLAAIQDKFNRILPSADGFNTQHQEVEETKRRRQLQQRRSLLSSSSSSSRLPADDRANLRPGEKGFILRARVPQPEDREYIARPESKVTGDFEATARAARSQGRLAEFQRMFKSQKTKSKSRNMAAFQVNISGSFSANSK